MDVFTENGQTASNLEGLDLFEWPPGSILFLIKSRFLYARSRNFTTCSITARYICRLDSAYKTQKNENYLLCTVLFVIKFSKYKESRSKYGWQPSTLPRWCMGGAEVKLYKFPKSSPVCNRWSTSHSTFQHTNQQNALTEIQQNTNH